MSRSTASLLVACALAACAVATACAPGTPGADRAPAPESVSIRVGEVAARVHVARTRDARRRGLQGVRTLAPDEGMLFLYRGERVVTFWMGGCLVPLDVVFLDRGGAIIGYETLAPPGADGEEPERAMSPRAVARVLELPGGFLKRHGLGVGTRVTIPASALARQPES